MSVSCRCVSGFRWRSNKHWCQHPDVIHDLIVCTSAPMDEKGRNRRAAVTRGRWRVDAGDSMGMGGVLEGIVLCGRRRGPAFERVGCVSVADHAHVPRA